MPRPVTCRTARWIALAALVWLLGPAAAASAAPEGVAGTYRINSWRDLEARGLYHFFYLDPGGRFYLAGEWPGSETSRFGGTWSVQGDRLHLVGVADVKTSQGHWTIPFQRTFRVEGAPGAPRLTPLPEKNRFGLLGWPNAFVYLQAAPAVNLPGNALPADPLQLVRLSEALAP